MTHAPHVLRIFPQIRSSGDISPWLEGGEKNGVFINMNSEGRPRGRPELKSGPDKHSNAMTASPGLGDSICTAVLVRTTY